VGKDNYDVYLCSKNSQKNEMNLSINTRTFSLANIWFVILLLSFSYDKPILVISSFDRINPTLYDIGTLLGFFWLLGKGDFIRYHNIIYKKYLKIVLWFFVCTFLGLFIYDFPLAIKGYSLFYLFQYIQEIFVCFLVIQYLNSYPLDYDKLFKVLILGGVFVSIYCVYEYLNPGNGFIKLSSGLEIVKPVGYVWGPFTGSYFQLSNYSPIVGFITLCYSMTKTNVKKWIYILIALFIVWPSFVCGSRTAVGLVFTLLIIATFKNVKFKYFVFAVFILAILLFSLFPERLILLVNSPENTTIQRINNIDSGSNNSIQGRLSFILLWFTSFSEYVYQGYFVPIFGGGFYVAPMRGFYRVGFGWHNIYIFAIEQSGIFGLILFIRFFSTALKSLKYKVSQLVINSVNYWFTFAVRIIFISILIIGVFGAHSFWRGFSTGNFNSLRLILLIIATQSIINFKNKRHEKNIIN
jgi:hypothetical protein